MNTSIAAAIAFSAVRKEYGPTVALDNASFSIAEGRVHALLGENGAGKSTTVKILSGLARPTRGAVQIFGRQVSIDSPKSAHALGLQTAFQELTLIGDLTVAENMLMPYQPVGYFGQLKRGEGMHAVRSHLEALGLGTISPNAEVRDLELPQRQKIEIARALFRKPKILLLDESTSALSGNDVSWLANIVAQEKAKGTTIIFITHRMPEVRMFCDELTILRNGKTVGSYGLDDVTDDQVIELIVGRSIEKVFPKIPPVDRSKPPVLDVRNLSAGRCEDVSFAIRPGEVVGVAGLQGMGQRDLFLSLFGDVPRRSGSIQVDGNEVRIQSPRDAIKANIGISFVPEERKTDALFLRLDGRRNVTLPVIEHFTKWGLIDFDEEEKAVMGSLRRVQVADRALDAPASAFSGGNQQKIVMAKWLLSGSRVLLLFDPTRGVDVGTKHEIYGLINDYAAAGGAVMIYSTEIEEVVHLSHRVLVFYRGRIRREIDAAKEQITESAIIRAALGSEEARLEGAVQ